MAFDYGRKGKAVFTASGSLTFFPGCPYDLLQFALVWGAGSDVTDTIDISVDVDGTGTYIAIDASPWTGISLPAILQSTLRSKRWKLNYTKGAGAGLTVLVDALELHQQQMVGPQAYRVLADGDALQAG